MQIYDEANNRWIKHRDLPEYQLRKRKIRDGWIWLGVAMVFMPLNIVLVFSLLSCFLSLMFLDEKPYKV